MNKVPKWLFIVCYFTIFLVGGVWQYISYRNSFITVPAYERTYTLDETFEDFDLNTIRLTELRRIPGMTPASAKAVIAYREAHNGFRNTAELLDVEHLPQAAAVFLMQHCYVLPEIPEETVHVTEAESLVPTDPPVSEAYSVFPLNLNTATLEELCALPGIGETTAAYIVAYRSEIGGFTNRRQLLDVYGIGEAKLEKIWDYIELPDEIPLEVPDLKEPMEEPIADPMEEQTKEPPTEPPTEQEIPIIHLNTTTYEELLLLPDCTPEIAESILYLRELIHEFSSPLEILYTDGVTDELYIRWHDYLTI